MDVHLRPIGEIRSCFKEKFGIPRQSNLVADAPGTLLFYPEFAREEAVRSLDGFSHVWILFLFHKTGTWSTDSWSPGPWSPGPWSPMVRPPRLGGNKKVGVFASRSPFRPNPVGLSCLALKSIGMTERGPALHLAGVDILDRTPVLDVKPYLPYSDALPHARDGFAGSLPKPGLTVVFSDRAAARIRERAAEIPNLEAVLRGILENDPRPAYRGNTDPDRIYGIRLYDMDIKWRVAGEAVTVVSAETV
ncbi:MAG: tRNA (N6-threonylcarbamoyladenosine(37)-N6)-methyltransferase TrmO [Desulfobacterales bacterium]|nr:tRNA (N6-threonylcarbamoyladenosine(37)-N6)-methyltransferase TrmO [Desulfobacterales bacterium]